MKILRSRKALSPVVASIILIAVTVAVSIAVAAWMGALTFNFMATEQGQITYMTADTVAPGTITLTFKNSGTTAITIQSIYVNNVQLPLADATQAQGSGAPAPFTGALATKGNTIDTFVLTPGALAPITSGSQYEVKLISAAGHTFSSTVTAPT